MTTLTKELTVSEDLTVRGHLAQWAKYLRAKFHATTYQGDYVQVGTQTTYGDRVQVGTTFSHDGYKFFLVANVHVSRKSGGKLDIRVSAWTLAETGELLGYWPAIQKDTRTITAGLYLSPKGLIEVAGRKATVRDASRRIPTIVSQSFDVARTNIREGNWGRQVQVTHYAPKFNAYYDTDNDHLVPFGGADKVKALLMKGLR